MGKDFLKKSENYFLKNRALEAVLLFLHCCSRFLILFTSEFCFSPLPAGWWGWRNGGKNKMKIHFVFLKALWLLKEELLKVIAWITLAACKTLWIVDICRGKKKTIHMHIWSSPLRIITSLLGHIQKGSSNISPNVLFTF